MKAFSACLKIMKRRKITFLIYFSVFAALLICMVLLGDSSMYGDFTAKKPNYALISREEDGALVRGLMEVLDHTGTRVELEDSREAMMDAGFFQAVDCIFVIPKGYEQGFWNGEDASLQMWQWPSSSTGYYLSSAVEQYLSLIRMYQAAGGMSETEMAESAAGSMELETEVTVRHYTDGAVVSEKIRLFQRFIPYIMLLICISGVGNVFLCFKRPEIRMRNLCSPVKPVSFAVGKFLYACVVGIGVWVLLNVMGIVMCLKDWMQLDARVWILYLANSFVFLFAAVSVALLCSALISSENAMSFVTNIVSLAMCFVSGVFVPLDMMGSTLLKVAKFVPVYWFEENERRISSLTGFGWESLRSVYEGILIQAGFAAALFCIYLLVNKYQQQAEEDYGGVRTEIEQ